MLMITMMTLILVLIQWYVCCVCAHTYTHTRIFNALAECLHSYVCFHKKLTRWSTNIPTLLIPVAQKEKKENKSPKIKMKRSEEKAVRKKNYNNKQKRIFMKNLFSEEINFKNCNERNKKKKQIKKIHEYGKILSIFL